MAIPSYTGPQTLPIDVLISLGHSCRTPWAHTSLPGNNVPPFLDLCDVRQILGQLLGHVYKFHKGLRVHWTNSTIKCLRVMHI